MVRTHIQLTDEQARLLRELATAQGRSVADVICDGIELLLRSRQHRDRAALKQRPLNSLGRVSTRAPRIWPRITTGILTRLLDFIISISRPKADIYPD